MNKFDRFADLPGCTSSCSSSISWSENQWTQVDDATLHHQILEDLAHFFPYPQYFSPLSNLAALIWLLECYHFKISARPCIINSKSSTKTWPNKLYLLVIIVDYIPIARVFRMFIQNVLTMWLNVFSAILLGNYAKCWLLAQFWYYLHDMHKEYIIKNIIIIGWIKPSKLL